MKYPRLKNQVLRILSLLSVICLLSSLWGCEAFVRKFTRKRKEKKLEEPVLTPEEYSLSDISVEQRYRQYFLFWKSWQNELIAALDSSGSHKKRKDCIKQAIGNLKELRPFLFEEKQKELDVYIEKLRSLQNEISRDIYGTKLTAHRTRAESLKRNILRLFTYSNVENHLR